MAVCRCIILLVASVVVFTSFGQIAPGLYRVTFADKSGTNYSLSQPIEFLSQRAIDRRIRFGIPIDSLDLPVSDDNILQLSAALDMDIVHTSKWFNSVVIRSTDTLGLDTVMSLPCVTSLKSVSSEGDRHVEDKLEHPSKSEIGGHYEGHYGGAYRQVTMLNTHLLHEMGARGEGMMIGVLDSGFDHADTIPAFAHLFEENRILLTHDVADGGSDVYNDHTHGMSVLSTMAAYEPGVIVGTAPRAQYLLLRTEVTGSEFIWEEDNWVVGAEICDSAGCDILNTSLGYTTFDDSTMDHTYMDMDGISTRISLGATIASSKGMLPVNSAGNSGDSEWYYVGAPADARGVLSVGAVDEDREIASFSSHGPTSDGRLKPDVSALGKGTWGLHQWGMGKINGTSFSAPIVAGSVACLWQLHPDRSNAELMNAVVASAHLSNDPDNDIGNGIPDFFIAHKLLLDEPVGNDAESLMSVFPNGFNDHFFIDVYNELQDQVLVEMFTMNGVSVLNRIVEVDHDHFHRIRVETSEMANSSSGPYVLRVSMGELTMYRLLYRE